jgi:hypothetical protein
MEEELNNIEEFILSHMEIEDGFDKLDKTQINNIVDKIHKNEDFQLLFAEYKQCLREEKLKRLLDE